MDDREKALRRLREPREGAYYMGVIEDDVRQRDDAEGNPFLVAGDTMTSPEGRMYVWTNRWEPLGGAWEEPG